MKTMHRLFFLALPIIGAALLYSQISVLGTSTLPPIAEAPAREIQEATLVSNSTSEVIDVKTWEETERKSGRRR
jgi:hypothetical protein